MIHSVARAWKKDRCRVSYSVFKVTRIICTYSKAMIKLSGLFLNLFWSWKYQTLPFCPGIQWWVGDLWWPYQAAAERSWDWLPYFHRLEAPCHPGWVRGHGLHHWTGRGQKADRQTKLESPHIHRPPSKYTHFTQNVVYKRATIITYPLHWSWMPTSVHSKNKGTFIIKTFWEL